MTEVQIFIKSVVNILDEKYNGQIYKSQYLRPKIPYLLHTAVFFVIFVMKEIQNDERNGMTSLRRLYKHAEKQTIQRRKISIVFLNVNTRGRK